MKEYRNQTKKKWFQKSILRALYLSARVLETSAPFEGFPKHKISHFTFLENLLGVVYIRVTILMDWGFEKKIIILLGLLRKNLRISPCHTVLKMGIF
jgi:hypothetical protein